MSEKLVIACVKWGKRFGACYANILYDMVRRNLPPDYPFSFICFTDDPTGLHPGMEVHILPEGLKGWWNKLHLFKEGVFAPNQRVVYFDLDTLIIGDVEKILDYQGEFALLRDFYRTDGYGSGVMLWRGGAGYPVWSGYEAAGKPEMAGGDQAWLEQSYRGADRLQDIFPHAFASYKTDCHPLPPEGTSVVCFHGEPKQDNCDAPWVREVWKMGGAFDPDRPYQSGSEERLAHVRHAITLPCPWLERMPAHERQAVIIGGGASLNQGVDELRQHSQQGNTLFATSNSATWLTKHGISFNAHVMFNAREEHAAFVPEGDVTHYYASTCHPDVFAKALGDVVIWHPVVPGIAALLKDDKRPKVLLESSTCGLNAIRLAFTLGYRRLHVYGFDSCYSEGQHHAYAQADNDKDRVFDLTIGNRDFTVAAWMTQQAKEFVSLASELTKNNCQITVYGDGLIAFSAAQMAQSLS